jgi:sugar/nucleoside kinase (ribokinase family)
LRSKRLFAFADTTRSVIVRIAVTGSLAYDYIMAFPGYFKDHILPDKVHMLTVSFLVDSMKRMRGGVAGNIAYTLALLGERPLLCASAGQDFGEYRAWMERQGIDTAGLVQLEDEFTASCFINTDLANNQIVAFYTGAMAYSRNLSVLDYGLSSNDLVIISPTDPEAMSRYADECRTHGIPFVFDPGKQTPRLDGEQILAGLNGARVLIGNDYEFAMMAQKTGLTEEVLIRTTPLWLTQPARAMPTLGAWPLAWRAAFHLRRPAASPRSQQPIRSSSAAARSTAILRLSLLSDMSLPLGPRLRLKRWLGSRSSQKSVASSQNVRSQSL